MSIVMEHTTTRPPGLPVPTRERHEEGSQDDRPGDVSLPQHIRWCIDDLKAFYYEARMNQHPGVGEDDLHQWFWGETAMGKLIVDICKLMDASEDPEVKGTAFGLAR